MYSKEDALEMLAENRILADLTHGIVIEPGFTGNRIFLHSLNPDIFSAHSNMPIKDILALNIAEENGDLIEATPEMLDLLADRISSSNRYADITESKAGDVESMALFQLQMALASGHLFDDMHLNTVLFPDTPVMSSIVDDAAKDYFNSPPIMYSEKENVIVMFNDNGQGKPFEVVAGHPNPDLLSTLPPETELNEAVCTPNVFDKAERIPARTADGGSLVAGNIAFQVSRNGSFADVSEMHVSELLRAMSRSLEKEITRERNMQPSLTAKAADARDASVALTREPGKDISERLNEREAPSAVER